MQGVIYMQDGLREVIIGLKNTNLCVTIDEIGKTVFLTQAEAEQKLKEMGGENEID